MKIKFTFLIICWLIFQNISAQKLTGFSSKVEKYPEELTTVLGVNLTSEDKLLLDKFTTAWNTNGFDETEKKDIDRISVLIFDRKGRASHFKLLIKVLLNFKADAKNVDNYKTWMSFMGPFMMNKKVSLNHLTNLLEALNDLKSDHFLNNTNSAQWKYTGENYKFIAENDSFRIMFPLGLLKCYSKHDSIEIKETSGVYYPLGRKWLGKGGIVTWERAGYDVSEVFAKLNRYKLDLAKSELHADSVTYNYKKYFATPALGVLIDKVMHIQSKESATYPQFDSYNKRFYFKDLYENIDYDGGFSMRGAKIIGSGNETQDAKLTVKKGNQTLMEVRSKFFVFRPDKVTGINTIVKINIDQDSIFHSDLTFNYLVKEKEVNLFRSEEYSSRSPYNNTYHKMDMDFEQLTWRIEQSKINLTMSRASAIGNARFVSQNFFNQLQFESLQGIDAANPLVALRKFSLKMLYTRFPATAFANYLGRSLNEVRQVLMSLAEKGFIYYNIQTDEVIMKDRLQSYLNSSAGKIDFDVMSFSSTTQAPVDNAILDMDNYDLAINGISRIALSDSQNVTIYPTNQQIIMKQNRSFQFDGSIDAGLFSFYGSNFFFDYNKFKINLQNVDSVSIKVLTGEVDNFGHPVSQKIKSVIQHLTGELSIDKPDNKAGRHRYAEYPIFTSRENSYVYYQSKSIEHGVYPEESFFYQLDPFSIDSLTNFKKEGMSFTGEFQSAGILPPIKQPLVLEPDYTLGLTYSPGPGGTMIYEGKGHLYGDTKLDARGLHAAGKMTYLASTITSKDFKLYPDSMNTKSDEFTVAQQTSGVEFPQVDSKSNYVHWFTIEDKMFIHNGPEPFRIYNDQTNLTGTLLLEPKGLSGKGKMDLTTADLYSDEFKYKSQIIDADTSKFHLKSLHNKGFTVMTDNVKSHVDFTTRKGDFNANADYTLVQFPENKYISYLDYFKWNMDEKILEMGTQKTKSDVAKKGERSSVDDRFHFSQEVDGPRYISTDKKQDSLNFIAPIAVYDYQSNLLNASDVKLIRVADAIIYPSDGKVVIDEKAIMRPLFKTKIIANFKDSFHTVYDANVNIQSRFNFTGNGKYNYVDENEKIEVVDIPDIHIDTAIHTIAVGKIVEADSFWLSPYFAFQGKLTLNSSSPNLYFDGGSAIKTECEKLGKYWLKFSSVIEPKSIFIPVGENPVTIDYKKIYAGFFIASDSVHVYPAFLSAKRRYSDHLMLSSSGFLHYNKDAMAYEIASKDKLLNKDTTGSYLSFYKVNCVEYGEGKISLGIDLGQMKISTYGNMTSNLMTHETILDVLLSVDYMFDPNALKLMVTAVNGFPSLEGLDIKRGTFVKSLNEFMDWKTANTYREEMTLLGKPKSFPPEMDHTIYLTSLSMKWNQATKSFVSFGKVGLGNVKDNQINKMMDGVVEIFKRRTGDMMDIYLEPTSSDFYYYGYTRGNLQVYSSNNEFVNFVKDLPLRSREMKINSGQTPFIYLVASDVKFRSFLRDYKSHSKVAIPDEEQPNVQSQDAPVNQSVEEKPEDKKPNDQPTENKPAEGEVIEVK